MEEMNCHKKENRSITIELETNISLERIICNLAKKRASILEFKKESQNLYFKRLRFQTSKLGGTPKVSSVISSQSFLVIDNTC
jgi:hypothetical protein